jgi:hypothetical protein
VRKIKKTPLCQCVGCGCDDDHACQDLLGDACRWLVKSESGRLGVCTQCPGSLGRWNANKRQFSDRAKQAIADRVILQRASRPRRTLTLRTFKKQANS